MQCPKCGQANPQGARFCNECGISLIENGVKTDLKEAAVLDDIQGYIPQTLADKIRVLGRHLESERRHVTVVFADMSGFTAISEVLDPEVVSTTINACFRSLVEVIFKYEGTIDKFIGDGIMALFGAPIAHENDPERAVRAALELLDRLREFNSKLQVPLPQPLTMHVGINSGEVIAGNVGSDLRMDYSVLGDTVNLAARLEAASESGKIFVSEKTYALTRHVFQFKKLRPFKVKGKKRRVQAYEVLDVKERPESGRGVQAGYGPLIDREKEMEQLRTVVETVQQQGQVLGIVGEAGIGKSRLVYELPHLISTSIISTSGSCVAYEAPASYQIFSDVVRNLLRIETDDKAEVIHQKLESWVIAHNLDIETVAPYFGSLLGLRNRAVLYLSDDERHHRFMEALLAAFRKLTATGPLLLVLEDLQWIDPQSRRLLDSLVPQVGTMPLLLCCVYRPEFRHEWSSHLFYQTLAIEPLPPEQTVALSRALVDLDLPLELEDLIAERTEGNPFFVEEMIKALIDEGVIERTKIGYGITKDVTEVRLPETIQGIIMARIDRLEVQARETLQYASVIGRRFSHGLLQTVSPRSDQVEQDLAQLQSLELVYQHTIFPELEYIFKHFVTREVAYNSILAARRKTLHLSFAQAIEKLYQDRLEDYYEALAHHFAAGEDWQKAAEYFGKASTKARELHSDEGANSFSAKRDQAVQKVFEQREEGFKTRRDTIYWLVCILAVGLSISVFLWLKDEGFYSIVLFVITLLWIPSLISVTRSKGADSVTVYSDCLTIRGREGLTKVLFQSITSIFWIRHMSQWRRHKESRGLLPHRKARVFWGTVRYNLQSLLYFGLGSLIKITTRDDTPLVLGSSNSGDLYRELKLAVTKWAAVQQVGLKGLFKDPLRFEEQYHLPLKREDGTLLPLTTYDRLVEMIERGEVNSSDEIAIRDETSRKEAWVTLEAASREDRRIWAALQPFQYGLAAFRGQPLRFVLAVCFLTNGFVWGERYFTDPQSLSWAAAIRTISVTLAPTSILVLGTYLRWAFLEWTKRLMLPRWQQIGLKVVTGFVVIVLTASVATLTWNLGF